MKRCPVVKELVEEAIGLQLRPALVSGFTPKRHRLMDGSEDTEVPGEAGADANANGNVVSYAATFLDPAEDVEKRAPLDDGRRCVACRSLRGGHVPDWRRLVRPNRRLCL